MQVCVDAESARVHTAEGTAGHVHEITESHSLLHGQDKVVFARAAHQGAGK